VRLAEQQSWRTPHQAYRGWRTAIEARHALTFQIAGVDTAEALGFSLAFDVLPVIAVNQKLKPNGRIFTLLHELVHVAMGASGLCDLVEEAIRPAAEQLGRHPASFAQPLRPGHSPPT
jgi:Zn-dependent peptidase ImmA (M78 family)